MVLVDEALVSADRVLSEIGAACRVVVECLVRLIAGWSVIYPDLVPMCPL